MSTEPIHPKEPQDDAAASAQQELDDFDGRSTIEFDGETYLIDYSRVNDIEVLEAFQRGTAFFPAELNGALTALQKSLGADYEKFKRDQVRKHGVCSATAIFEMFSMVNIGAGGNS